MARLITLGVLIGIISSFTGTTVAGPLSYNDCLSEENCISALDQDTLAVIKVAIPDSPIEEILAAEEKASEPALEDEMGSQEELSDFLSNHQNNSFEKRDQTQYANRQYRKDLGGFTRVQLTSEERAHINSVIDDTFSGTKVSRDLLTVAFDNTKKVSATNKHPSDPYILHKIIAFHVALIFIALIFFKVSG